LADYLKGRPTSRVVVETCTEAFAVAEGAAELGHEVRVVPATLVRSLGVGARGVKTDRRDAQVLSEVSTRIDLPSVHLASRESRERKTLCGMREALVGARTKLINTVRGWLRGQATTIRSGAADTLSKRVRDAFPKGLPSSVTRQLGAIDMLTEQIHKADDELAKVAKADSVCSRLMSVPGVGPVTAVRFVAALDDVTRFESAHKVESFLGLTPGENSSSERQRRTSITKAGPRAARWALVQAAWAARRAKGVHPMVIWSLEVEKRRGKRVAILALARKLAGILYAIWRDGTFYDRMHHTPQAARSTA
jgi:transposase